MAKFTKTFQYGAHKLTIETGEVARQATAAVVVDMDGTVVLVSAVALKNVKEGQDFFPLTVNYQERAYAAGKVPGGYFKREGRPSENETLVSRLIDRPLRPLFPEGFLNEVQIVATVMSLNPEVNPDIPALIGASAALCLAGLPFHGPLGAARVGYIEGEYILNPTQAQLKTSELDLVVAGTEEAVLMVESEAKMLSEEIMLNAVWYGHEQMQIVIKAINELTDEAGVGEWTFEPHVVNEVFKQEFNTAFADKMAAVYQLMDKQARRDAIAVLRTEAIEKFAKDDAAKVKSVVHVFEALESTTVRHRILDGFPRIDGRDTRTVRPITIKPSFLPRTHGSVLFTRGETQAIVVATLGTTRDAQTIDSILGEQKDNFMLHYNFPPYCVGETGQVGSPKRREIGHGRLAKRGVAAVLPSFEEFPYVLRVVSEITESNGSSSMASVCGTSLALMDAGVPLKAPVAGIAMGLIKEGDKHAILTDILGDEDHLGDMDFKVAGTAEGITALQMDIKITGITGQIMQDALAQAKDGRMHILKIMNEVLPRPREQMSAYAPRIITIKINPEKIRDVIGKGGSVIRALTEETGATIDITDDGVIKIASVDKSAGEEALRRIKQITAEVEIGTIYEGTVTKIMDFGAFVTILPGRDGLVHVSQIADKRVENVNDYLAEGQHIKVKVLEIDKQGRIKLTMKNLE